MSRANAIRVQLTSCGGMRDITVDIAFPLSNGKVERQLRTCVSHTWHSPQIAQAGRAPFPGAASDTTGNGGDMRITVTPSALGRNQDFGRHLSGLHPVDMPRCSATLSVNVEGDQPPTLVESVRDIGRVARSYGQDPDELFAYLADFAAGALG